MTRILIPMLIVSFPMQTAPHDPAVDETRAPRVKSVVPANGATGVDPTSDEIRVTFDMPMNHDGYSFVGRGPSFPAPRGRPRWVDAYTCVLPVKLKPGRKYRFGLNSATHQSFRSVWLVSAEPYVCSFTTGGVEAVVLSPAARRKLNIESFDALAGAIRRRYSYRDLRVSDWEKVFGEHRADVVGQTSTRGWMKKAARMLALARDVHMTVSLDDDVLPTFSRDVRPNFARGGVKRVFPNLQRHGTVSIGLTDDNIVYLLIESWSSSAGQDVRRAHDFLTAHADAAGVIIDVRPNSGGSETLARGVASRFIVERRVYAAHVFRRGPGADDFTPVRERAIEPCDQDDASSPCRYRGPVAVLTGAHVMSSCEAFLLMMKQAPNARLVGERSYGSSGNPGAVFLPNGVKVMMPSWKALAADGACFEGKGIAPDIVVPSVGVDFNVDDPVLRRALEFLRSSKSP